MASVAATDLARLHRNERPHPPDLHLPIIEGLEIDGHVGRDREAGRTVGLDRHRPGSNIVMGCSKMGPDYIYAWPTTEFAPTGPEMIVQAVFHKQLARAKEEGNYEDVYNFFLNILREEFSVMTFGKLFTTWYTVNEVIDPRETRSRIIHALHATVNKRESVPEKRRFIKPA
ncbi:MAG: carboxyl transferase domain-containing protein [Candidatus Desulfacyla sp.]